MSRDIRVRPLRSSDVPASAKLHLDVIGTEFLARGGEKFLRRYHAAWSASPFGMALGAVDGDEQLLGVLLGTVSPRAHYQRMFRDHGAALALALLQRGLLSPRFGFELLATRGLRYARAAVLQLAPARHGQGGSAPTPGHQVGEVTHLMVSPEAQGKGVGRLLVEEAERIARGSGLDELVLVTPPDLPARQFYEHLGWQDCGEVRSRSGEVFVRYRVTLGP